jgi:hypothetical protein
MKIAWQTVPRAAQVERGLVFLRAPTIGVLLLLRLPFVFGWLWPLRGIRAIGVRALGDAHRLTLRLPSVGLLLVAFSLFLALFFERGALREKVPKCQRPRAYLADPRLKAGAGHVSLRRCRG